MIKDKLIFSIRTLRSFCPPQLLEEIEGDLIQKFERDVKSFGDQKASRRLLWNVIRFFRPGIVLRNRFGLKLNLSPLLQNYLKITLRNLDKRRAYALINVLGLAVGMAVCLVIGKYLEYETSYDAFHSNGKNIYRVISSFYTDGAIEPYCGNDLGPALSSSLPEIKRYARIHGNSSIVSVKDSSGKLVKFYEPNLLLVDSSFLEMFTFKFIDGNSASLYDPFSIVLTKSVATKYFGDHNPIGKEIYLLENWVEGTYVVSAVIEDVPSNSHFDFDLLMPMHNALQSEMYRNGNNARWDNFHTYVEMHEQASPYNLQTKIPAFMKKYRGDDKRINAKSEFQFQPLLDIHYSPDLKRPGSHQTKLYFFGLIAIFILIMAWINYVNLATARAMERAREVGVKKALGVLKGQLMSQFIFEAIVVNLFSMTLALGLAWLAIPLLNSIVGHTFVFDVTQPQLWMLLFVLFVTGSFAAGFYPAFVLSSFKTTEVMKGKTAMHTSGFSFRNSLVVFQFASSLLLLVGTFAVYRQVSFLQQQDKNLNTDQILVMGGPELVNEKSLGTQMISFKNELKKLSAISKVATSFSVPAKEASISTGMRKLGQSLEENRIGNIYWVDPDFMDLYQIQLLSGKFWDQRSKAEMKQVIINEEAVKVFQLGTNENALQEKIISLGDTLTIAGVVKNHHWHSLKESFRPMLFRVEEISAANISIQLNRDAADAIEQIQKRYLAAFPGETFSYYFLNDFYNRQYQSEQQFGKLFSAFSVLAVLIGCLGLWGLASFTTLHRLKEISIRKVLGASVNSILFLLTKQFLRPLFISSLIALPLVWLGVTEWLKQFPYRIGFSTDLLLWPLAILSGIALLTISVQTVRAALSNPVNSLKNE